MVSRVVIVNYKVVGISKKKVVVGNMADRLVDKIVYKAVGDYMEADFHNIFLPNLVDMVGLFNSLLLISFSSIIVGQFSIEFCFA